MRYVVTLMAPGGHRVYLKSRRDFKHFSFGDFEDAIIFESIDSAIQYYPHTSEISIMTEEEVIIANIFQK